jgi:TctA family transporter
MSALGVLLGTVGTDVNSGAIRFTFGANELTNGVDFVPVAVGLFAIAEIGSRLGLPEVHKRIDTRIRGLVPSWNDLKASFGPILRGTGLGAVLGVLPGTGPLICAFGSYALERKLSRHPENFGRGAIEGVAGPEAANNAAAFTHFIPMLTLGIPAGATMALMLGALMIQGIAPGPQVMSLHPDLFWGLVASMWLGNLMLLVLNLPLIGVWIRLLSIPYRFLYPVILVFCCIGAYSINNSAFDVGIAACIGALGYFLHRMDCPPAPLILGLVLGPMLEDNLRRSLLISNGDPLVFFERPISLGLLLLTGTLVAVFSLPVFMPNKRQREQASLLGDEAKAHTDISKGA